MEKFIITWDRCMQLGYDPITNILNVANSQNYCNGGLPIEDIEESIEEYLPVFKQLIVEALFNNKNVTIEVTL